MKSFTTAVVEKVEGEEEDEGVLQFDLDGEGLTAYKPSEAQFALLMQAAGRHTATHEAVAGAMDFFHGTLDDKSARHVYNRLLDRKDPFGLEEVQEIIEWLVEEWTGHPTKQRSGSTGSRKPTGRPSTPRSRQ